MKEHKKTQEEIIVEYLCGDVTDEITDEQAQALNALFGEGTFRETDR